MGKVFALLVVLGVAAAAIVYAGNRDDDDAFAMDVTVEESGNKASITAPGEVDGGLVEVRLSNKSKNPAAAQLIRLDEGHTAEEALEVIQASEEKPIPAWLHGEGGVATTQPGKTGTATVNLEAGKYAVFNDEGEGGTPPSAEFTVSEAGDEELPDTDATVTADAAGEGKYDWRVEGLKAGQNEITFDSRGGENALHHIVVLPLKPDATLEDVQSFFKDEKGPPPFAGEESDTVSTTVLDGDKSMVTTLNLKPGKSVFACFLPDKEVKPTPHVEQGLLEVVEVR